MKNKEVINFFKKYLKNEKKLLFVGVILILIASVIGLTYGYIIGEVVQNTTLENYNAALFLLLLYLILAFLEIGVIERIGRINITKVTNKLMENISADTYDKVSKLPAVAYEEKNSGEFINRITNDSGTIADTLKQFISMTIQVLGTVTVFIYVLFASWIIALELLCYVIFFTIISRIYLPKIKESQKDITKKQDESIALITESIRGVREIKSLGIRKKYVSSIIDIIEKVFVDKFKQGKFEINYNYLSYLSSLLLEIIVLVTAIVLIRNGEMEISFLVSMTYYIYRFMHVSEYVINFASSYQKSKIAIGRISEITDNKLYEDEKFGNHNIPVKNGIIEFKNISFKYSNEEKNVFNNLNLTINKNEITALVGKSGQGKSSIFNLLLRYFDVNDGEILLDDVNIKDYTEDALRKSIAVIRQDPFIFNKTILENLKLVNTKLPLGKIIDACKKAQIHDYIVSLPKGYDTLIGEGGVNLSGGQKQRLAIARALLKESKIILFDEATSALDNKNQDKVIKVVNELSKNHTIIVVAHRLTTIEKADVIHIVKNGKIVSSGKHKYLLKNSKDYNELYNKEK